MDGNTKENGQKHAVDGIKKKRLYEPPKLTAVALFADQVLSGCNKQPGESDFCNTKVEMS